MTENDEHAELADVIVGRRPGRAHNAQRIVFDSTGTAIQDVATAVVVRQRALAANIGSSMQIGAI